MINEIILFAANIFSFAAINLVLSFIVHNAPFIFIICLSILVFHKELAQTVFVTEKTIEAHLANIYKKAIWLFTG